MTTPRKKKETEKFAYGSVLEALSQGLYPEKKHVIRELVQNCYDGLTDLMSRHPSEILHPVVIKIEGQSIFIGDKGIGMTAQKMREYRYLGFSTKKPTVDAGFRGIGKFSPISLCERIIVDSSPYGLAQRFRVIIDAQGMMERIKRGGNPPLEDLLRDHTSFEKAPAGKGEHYTFVELHKVREDARSYLEAAPLKEYLRRTAPVPFDPAFKHAATIETRLRKHVPRYLAIDLSVNGEKIYKPYLEPCEPPQEDFVIDPSNLERPLAYSWVCANSVSGQFKAAKNSSEDDAEKRHPDSGLVFRVRNIAVGDRFLPRRTFWKRSPELSFHFFGEIHVVDRDVMPSSDRTDFEDNGSRAQLYAQSVTLASTLNLLRRAESQERNFDRKIADTQATIAGNAEKLKKDGIPVEVKDDHAYAVKKALEDLKKRLDRSQNPRKKSKARAIVKEGEKLLAKLKSPSTPGQGFIDITKELKLDAKMAALYNTIVTVLHDELKYDPARFEALVARIHEALRAARI